MVAAGTEVGSAAGVTVAAGAHALRSIAIKIGTIHIFLIGKTSFQNSQKRCAYLPALSGFSGRSSAESIRRYITIKFI
jgi:hypothetical protein